MSDRDAATLIETPVEDMAKVAGAAINQLKAAAEAALESELQAIAEAAGGDDGQTVSRRLTRHGTLDDLVGAAAWLARDLVDVLLKVATGNDPHAVMDSDLPARIRKAEVRLELLREMSR